MISTIRFMLDLSVSCVPKPCLHMIGSSSLTRVFRMCNCFAPVVCECWVYHTRSSCGISTQRTVATVHSRVKHNFILKFSEGSPYNATVVLRKIRCIKGLTSYAIYKWHDMAIILCFLISITKAPARSSVGENTISSWNFSERSPHNATVVLSKIRCIKGLTSHAIHKWHDMAIIMCSLISITKAPARSSCHRRHKHRHDLLVTGATPWSPSSCHHRGCRAIYAITTKATN